MPRTYRKSPRRSPRTRSNQVGRVQKGGGYDQEELVSELHKQINSALRMDQDDIQRYLNNVLAHVRGADLKNVGPLMDQLASRYGLVHLNHSYRPAKNQVGGGVTP